MLLLVFFNVHIFSVSAISCSLVIRWVYQHLILAVEVKTSTKVTLLSFNTTAVFLYKVMVSENDVFKAGYSAVDVFACVIRSSGCNFELHEE